MDLNTGVGVCGQHQYHLGHEQIVVDYKATTGGYKQDTPQQIGDGTIVYRLVPGVNHK